MFEQCFIVQFLFLSIIRAGCSDYRRRSLQYAPVFLSLAMPLGMCRSRLENWEKRTSPSQPSRGPFL